MNTEVKKKNFDAIIQESPLVLVDFFTEWCGPCKMMTPILKEVKDLLGDSLKIVKIDVEKNMGVSYRYNVVGVPTLILFKNGKNVWRQSGMVTATDLLKVVDEVASSEPNL